MGVCQSLWRWIPSPRDGRGVDEADKIFGGIFGLQGFFSCRCILGASTEVPGCGSFPISANVRLPGVWGVVDTEFQALAGLLPGTVLQNLGGTRAVWRLAKLDELIEQSRTEGGSSMLFMF